MEDLTLESIAKAYREMAAISPQIMWRSNRERCAEMDLRDGRGFLIINPELDLGEMDVNGCIVKKDGIEYRVMVDDRIRGMRIKDEDGNETDQIHPGWWIAPPPSLEELMKTPLTRRPEDA